MTKKKAGPPKRETAHYDRERIIQATLQVLERFAGMAITLRQVFYRLVEEHRVIPKTLQAYKSLSAILVEARLSGAIPLDALADLTRDIVDEPDAEVEPAHHFERWLDAFKRCDTLFEIPRWADQEYYVEVWVEKAAMQPFFQQVTKELEVGLFPTRGYPSLSSLKVAADRWDLVDDDKERVMLYFGDFDPSGVDITRYVSERLEEIRPGLNVDVERIAINRPQIEEHDLPTAPPKESDSRTARFQDEHGEETVELEAFEPDTLADLIRSAIEGYWDDGKYEETEARQTEGRRLIRDRIDRTLR